MGKKKIVTIVNEKIEPWALNEKSKAKIEQLVSKYPYDFLVECINIGVSKYLQYDNNGNAIRDSVEIFIDKLGGIAYNRSLNSIEQEIVYLKNKGRNKFNYWDQSKADGLLHDYVDALLRTGWTEETVLADLRGELSKLINSSPNWSFWYSTVGNWITDIRNWKDDDVTFIEQLGTVLPDALFNNLSPNFQSLCKQINASYENNLYDCTAVVMRRLLEGLLILSYQNLGIDQEIKSNDGISYKTLDKIIKNAEQNKTLGLSSNTKRDMALFKDLGNYSAHKIWYNCTQGDIKPHILRYRVIIEELLYKSGMIN